MTGPGAPAGRGEANTMQTQDTGIIRRPNQDLLRPSEQVVTNQATTSKPIPPPGQRWQVQDAEATITKPEDIAKPGVAVLPILAGMALLYALIKSK